MKILITTITLSILLGCSSSVNSDIKEKTLPTQYKIWEMILDDARYAQNAHNIQSWNIHIISDMEATITLDLNRMLPETDPVNRQLILSLGAFTAVAEMKASNLGYQLEATWLETETNQPQIILSLDSKENLKRDDLIDTLTSPTVKYAVQATELDRNWGEGVTKKYSNHLVNFNIIDDQQDVEDLKQIALDAFIIEMEHPPTRDESVINTHIGKKVRKEKPYGITLLPNIKKTSFPIMEFFAALFPLKDDAFSKQSIKMFEKALTSAQVLISMTTIDNRLETQFRSGIEMQKMWMAFISKNYSLLPLSQGLQEYEEVAVKYEEFHNILTEGVETVQMLWSVTSPIDGEFLQSPRLETRDIVTF